MTTDLQTLPERIATKLHYEPTTGCLLWTGCASKGGRWSLEPGEPWREEARRSRITLIGRATEIDERWLDMTIARCVAGQARRGA